MEWFIDDAPVVGKKCKICDETFYYNLDTEIFCPTCKKTLKKLIIQNIE
jgi:rubredoxin